MQGLQAIGLEMQAADTEHSYSKDAPNWTSTLAAMEATIEEGQEFVRRQDAAQMPASLGSPAAAQPAWQAALEQAVTSVLLWAQSASKAPGAQLSPYPLKCLLLCLATRVQRHIWHRGCSSAFSLQQHNATVSMVADCAVQAG